MTISFGFYMYSCLLAGFFLHFNDENFSRIHFWYGSKLLVWELETKSDEENRFKSVSETSHVAFLDFVQIDTY